MTDRFQTRRDYLRQVGGFAAVPLSATADASRTDRQPLHEVAAADLVIPERAAPVGFQTAVEPDDPPILSTLRAADGGMTPVDTAGRGYWAGHDEENPQWVLSCLTIVCDQPVVRQTVETVGSQVHEEFVAEYDAETPSHIDFEQSRTQHATMIDWRMDMVRPDPFSDTSSSRTEILFTDVMRLQYHENVLLGTVVFGPDATDRDVETMLTRYSNLQHSRLQSHSTDI